MDGGIAYREDFGLWWPDYDHNPVACHSKLIRRLRDVDLTTNLCKNRRCVVQAGGHVGMWPKQLAKNFDSVVTCEPDPYLYQCLSLNLIGIQNIFRLQVALTDMMGFVMMAPHASAGSWSVKANGSIRVPSIRIDYLLRSMPKWDCDAIVLDIEGSELLALQGAEETIERCSPVIHVEGLPRHTPELHQWILNRGYKLVREIHNDAIYSK